MGLLSSLFNTAKWNADPYSKQLAQLILEGAVYEASGYAQGKEFNLREVLNLQSEAGWRDKETADRLVHAVSMLRPIADARTFQAAKDIAMNAQRAFKGMTFKDVDTRIF